VTEMLNQDGVSGSAATESGFTANRDGDASAALELGQRMRGRENHVVNGENQDPHPAAAAMILAPLRSQYS
jgi:hypothetical protein